MRLSKTLRVFPTKGSQSAARIICCLPLPVGEAAERSEDGEGKQLPYKKAALPSQSPAVTALPKGEP